MLASARRLVWTLLFVFLTVPVMAQDLPSIEDKTQSFTRKGGFFPVYWDEAGGKVWLEIPRMNEAFLYVSSLPAGLGSNDIGLDRGQLGSERVVHFERVGPKVLLVAPNLRYRAGSDNEAERRAVRDAFAEGILWGFTVAAETDGRVLVDATDFVVRDAHGIVRRLKGMNQGNYSLNKGRSAPNPEVIKAFPNNTEMEARLTFTGDNPGRYVRGVAADPFAVTLRVRHSFVKLPPPGYTPRVLHPASGFFSNTYRDYAVPIGEDITKRFIARHRLEKQDPNAAVSEAVQPIVYYLDPGTPEPVRSALLDGARWWAEAFEAAGFRNAFRVEILPEGADPMDVRYSTIQWVHRATRGWSYGSSVSDPRTGEIIKGHVSLGSLRIRQDYLIAEGLLAPYTPDVGDRTGDPMLEMALARIRQLSAHEVGHTLGLAHNFAASVNNRASVMDYPAPLATLAGEQVSLDAAYDTGIGEWDKVAVRYGYSQFPEGTDEAAALNQILDEAHAAGLYFITDSDARPPGAAHPLANLWDNGDNMIEALDREMQVRREALARFGLTNIREGRPLATMEEALVPLYLRHRYQVDATVKLIGGVEYSYAMRGDARPLPQPVPAEVQRTALNALLETISPEVLRLPPNLRTQIPPRPPGYGQHRELFAGHTGLTFDPYAPAEVAAGLVLGLLIHPQRAARTAYQGDFDTTLPGFTEVLEHITREVWETRISEAPYDAELQRLVQQVWVDELVALAANNNAAAAVRARATQHLGDLLAWLQENPGPRRDTETIAHRGLVRDQIDRYLFRFYRAGEGRTELTTPPGSPIGQEAPDYLQRRSRRRALLEAWSAREEVCGFARD
ncbi:MAG: zinc-dependent metalloprotease [Rhodothermales bacterium]